MMKHRGRFVGLGIAFLVALIFLPQLLLIVRFKADTYNRLESVPAREYGVVFGAYVEGYQTLTQTKGESKCWQA